MRVVIADPPAFTPPYDHELAAALARAGADVDLVTSRFRFGTVVEPDGYGRREIFYPLSSRLFKRSRLRLPLKALEHPLGLVRLARIPADIVHFQWLAAPELDARLLRHDAPLVFTAHDLLPRRTASKTAPVATALRPLRRRCGAQPARPRRAHRVRGRRRQAACDPPSGVPGLDRAPRQRVDRARARPRPSVQAAGPGARGRRAGRWSAATRRR